MYQVSSLGSWISTLWWMAFHQTQKQGGFASPWLDYVAVLGPCLVLPDSSASSSGEDVPLTI